MAWIFLAAGLSSLFQAQARHTLGLLHCSSIFCSVLLVWWGTRTVYIFGRSIPSFSWDSVLSVSFSRIIEAFGFACVFGSMHMYFTSLRVLFNSEVAYRRINVITSVVIFFLVSETKRNTFEELDYVYEYRTHLLTIGILKIYKTMSVSRLGRTCYQLTKAPPYFISRYVCRHKDATLEPLSLWFSFGWWYERVGEREWCVS